MRNVKENIGMGDKKSNTKGVSPHLIPTPLIMRNVKENIGMGDKKSNTKGVSPHLIVRLPGKGGMAEVYEVENAWPGRENAIL